MIFLKKSLCQIAHNFLYLIYFINKIAILLFIKNFNFFIIYLYQIYTPNV